MQPRDHKSTELKATNTASSSQFVVSQLSQASTAANVPVEQKAYPLTRYMLEIGDDLVFSNELTSAEIASFKVANPDLLAVNNGEIPSAPVKIFSKLYNLLDLKIKTAAPGELLPGSSSERFVKQDVIPAKEVYDKLQEKIKAIVAARLAPQAKPQEAVIATIAPSTVYEIRKHRLLTVKFAGVQTMSANPKSVGEPQEYHAVTRVRLKKV